MSTIIISIKSYT